MFRNSKFNGDISKWNVANCDSFRDIFRSSSFSRDISQWHIRVDADCSFMIKPPCARTFQVPMVAHWMLALNGACIKEWPTQWQKHFNDYAPLARSIALSPMEAIIFLQNAWLQHHAEHDAHKETFLLDFNL